MSDKKIDFVDHLSKTTVPISEKLKSMAENTLNSVEMPTTRNEAWKYTRVAKINKVNFNNGTDSISSSAQFIIDKDAVTLFFINGQFSPQHSNLESVEGVLVETLKDSNKVVESQLTIENEVFNAVNTLFLNDGVRIQIEKNTQVEKTIQIIHVLSGDTVMSNFKTIIEAGAFSKAHIIQGFFTESDAIDCFSNISTEVNLGTNAYLTIDKVQYENDSTYHIATEEVRQEKDSNFTINTATLNGKLVRNNLNIQVNGENCETNLYGSYLLKGKQHVDNHTVVDHKVANCNSNELYKGVIDENATAVFNGKVFVRPDAQKINAFQSNGNVLLSDNGTVNSKPELEIYADDVKCSHGSTTGQLDDDAIFYLRARGLSEKSAYKLLVSAFVAEALENITNESVRTFIDQCLTERFGWIS